MRRCRYCWSSMKKIALNTAEEGICRTLLATYHKVGSFNVFEHDFPAVMEYEGDDFRDWRLESPEGAD